VIHWLWLAVVGYGTGFVSCAAAWRYEALRKRHVHHWGPWEDVPVVYPRVGSIFPEVHTTGQERGCLDPDCGLRQLAS
jgi:hypothetical protein